MSSSTHAEMPQHYTQRRGSIHGIPTITSTSVHSNLPLHHHQTPPSVLYSTGGARVPTVQQHAEPMSQQKMCLPLKLNAETHNGSAAANLGMTNISMKVMQEVAAMPIGDNFQTAVNKWDW
jgi:hypothetical protein